MEDTLGSPTDKTPNGGLVPVMSLLADTLEEEMSEGVDRMAFMTTLHVDCDGCAARGPGCADCVISVLLGPPGEVDFDDSEVEAMAVLADAGLVPPLRLVSTRREHDLGDILKVV